MELFIMAFILKDNRMNDDNFILNITKTTPILISQSLVSLQKDSPIISNELIELNKTDLYTIVDPIRKKDYLFSRNMILSIKNQLLELKDSILKSDKNILIFDNMLQYLAYLADELFYKDYRVNIRYNLSDDIIY